MSKGSPIDEAHRNRRQILIEKDNLKSKHQYAMSIQKHEKERATAHVNLKIYNDKIHSMSIQEYKSMNEHSGVLTLENDSADQTLKLFHGRKYRDVSPLEERVKNTKSQNSEYSTPKNGFPGTNTLRPAGNNSLDSNVNDVNQANVEMDKAVRDIVLKKMNAQKLTGEQASAPFAQKPVASKEPGHSFRPDNSIISNTNNNWD